jgi:hypothetical protein
MFRRSIAALCSGARSGPFDPYKILGVLPGASPQEIKKRYHELALRFHPDSGKPESSKERFQAVQEAYEAVKDGKWNPAQGSESSSSHSGAAYGFDSKSKMYVYEQPGSTSDNYVSSDGRLQTFLRVVMLWCFCFFVARFALLKAFPANAEAAARLQARRQAEVLERAPLIDEEAIETVVDFSKDSFGAAAREAFNSATLR